VRGFRVRVRVQLESQLESARYDVSRFVCFPFLVVDLIVQLLYIVTPIRIAEICLGCSQSQVQCLFLVVQSRRSRVCLFLAILSVIS
jgi:hypothetical protein